MPDYPSPLCRPGLSDMQNIGPNGGAKKVIIDPSSDSNETILQLIGEHNEDAASSVAPARLLLFISLVEVVRLRECSIQCQVLHL